MKSGYFNSPTIKPLVTGAAQHAAFDKGDVYFDWTSFEIPRGVARLIGATVSVRPKGDEDRTPNDGGIDLIFAKDSAVSATPTSLGTLNASGPTNLIPNLIGTIEVGSADFVTAATSNPVGAQAVGTTNHSSPLIFEPEPNSGGNVGVDKYWVAGVCVGSADHSSILVVDDADIASAGHTTIVTSGTNIDNTEHFLAGDVIHAHDDAVVGTLASVAASAITLTSELGTSILTNGDTLYNINPIEITLHFSK